MGFPCISVECFGWWITRYVDPGYYYRVFDMFTLCWMCSIPRIFSCMVYFDKYDLCVLLSTILWIAIRKGAHNLQNFDPSQCH